MTTRSFDFDHVPPRAGTGSYKWDSRPGMIPLWVADMDFPTAPCVLDALKARVDHGIFGYTLVGDDYYKALTSWFADRHDYKFSRRDVLYTSGVVPAISAIIKALVNPGQGIIVQTPVYNCFFSSIRNNGCKVVENALIREDINDNEFTYRMDTDGLERLCTDPANRMLILCNPANPAGRLWRRDELEEVALICRRHGVQVVSDEIHCELTMPAPGLPDRYIPYGTVDDEAIVCLSPSKAFNTAGLQIANIVCHDKAKRDSIDRAININEVCDVNPFGVVGLTAAYTEDGARWLEALREYLYSNWLMTREIFARELPGCPVARLEATYLPWVDISSTGLGADEAEHILLEQASVWINSGVMYGSDGYIRLNIACPEALLAKGLARLCSTLNQYSRF